MAEETPDPTHQPKSDTKPVPRGYVLEVEFQPPIKLERKQACEFAASLSEYLEPQAVEMDENSWTIKQQLGNSATGTLEIKISQTSIRFMIVHPTHPLEWIEHRFEAVLKEFERRFSPRVILNSSATYTGTMQIDGDARTFLSRGLINVDPHKLRALNRPVHLLGIRLFLPPFKAIVEKPTGAKGKKPVKGERVVEWDVNVKAESLIEDPTKLYLEAEAQWPTMGEWKKDTIQQVIGHLASVSEYLQNDVVKFLRSSVNTEESP